MTRAITLRIDDEAYKRLSEQAKDQHRSLANYILFQLMQRPIADPGRVQGDQAAATSEAIRATRLAALDQLYGLWEDHPVKSPEKYVRALRSKGRAKRLSLR